VEGEDSKPMKNADILLAISVTALVLYFVASILIPGLASPIAWTYRWLLDISLLLGYGGDFLVSFLGNATILVPFPYMGATFILGGLTDEITSQFLFDPWLVGIISGIGAALGEMTGYLIGYGGGRLIADKKRNAFSEYIGMHPKATPLVIWFLAATPIPDDVLIVPLGAARYSWWKVLIPQFIGKTMFMCAIAWSGRFGLDFVGTLIGNTGTLSITSRAIEVGSVLLVVLAIYILVRIDWTKFMSGNEILEDAEK
jgi:membrane protein YqaA with SNARE-associated domain